MKRSEFLNYLNTDHPNKITHEIWAHTMKSRQILVGGEPDIFVNFIMHSHCSNNSHRLRPQTH